MSTIGVRGFDLGSAAATSSPKVVSKHIIAKQAHELKKLLREDSCALESINPLKVGRTFILPACDGGG